LLPATPAAADFGIANPEVAFLNEDGGAETRAGSHPAQMITSFELNTKEEEGIKVTEGALRDLTVIAPEGFAGNPTAVPRCATIDFLQKVGGALAECADSTAVGWAEGNVGGGLGIEGTFGPAPLYNLQPTPGTAAKLGFWVVDVPVILNVTARPTPPYNILATLSNTSQVVEVFNSQTTLWGNPAHPDNDPFRGECVEKGGSCPADIPPKPFLTMPRSCTGPLETIFEATSWWTGDPLAPSPGTQVTTSAFSPGMESCASLDFAPALSLAPTSQRAESPSGLDLTIEVDDEGIGDPDGIAASDIASAVLELPEGMTLNPSAAEGLASCSLAQLDAESAFSAPGAGCPQASKLGTLEVETPILEDQLLRGSFFLGAQNDPAAPGKENPFDSLIALYMVIKDPGLGLAFKIAGRVEPDPRTGQLLTIFENLPPYPVSRFRARLREGGRSPLITPPTCGTHAAVATLTPSANPTDPLQRTATFQIASGPDGGPCPAGATQPFSPGFVAGTANNSAATFSPFHMRLTRRDGDQDLTRFDATLPPGALAKLAGVEKCSDAAIAAAKAKPGKAELAQPSCPPGSQIGTALGGAGAGSQLTYAKGNLYLAGPVAGAPLSVVGIVPAVAGPFDVGTVVVRQALRVDPVSGVASVDGASSDPIPHILAGIPLRVRDIRVDVDRPSFTLNPTSCDPFATVAEIWGGGPNVFSTADDSPARRSSRFQAANCARLGFKPRLNIKLKGGTKRGGHPALQALYRPRPGDANLQSVSTRLPRSAFLDQAHIRTICTRVQFAADACPPGAIYGTATATTPLLEEPLSGPVYLRSSDNELPDLVLDLHGLVDVEVSARIDSVKGGIRASFADAPDAPVTRVVLRMRGAKKGLVINSTDLCARRNRARVVLGAQSGKRLRMRPVVRAAGCKKRKR
jgi:hypothetical protein